MATGRYHKWLEPDSLLLLQAWARDGLINEQIAKNMGITTETLRVWSMKFVVISDAIKKGKEVVDIEVENVLFKRTLGYDYEGFSARVSLLYQANIFKNINFWPEYRQDTDKYTRWDLSIKQKLPWYGIQAFLNINNINGARDVNLEEGNNYPASIQDYDMTADLGFRDTL